MKTRPEGQPTRQEACYMIASYLMQRPAEAIDITEMSRIVDLPEQTIANDLRSLRQSQTRRPLVDRAGILSAAVAFTLIASGLVIHHLRPHQVQRSPISLSRILHRPIL